ncbi:MAG: ABC transporter ATP-binding protein [Rhodoferax sp.]|nr:ABC transporter ATP-binding protein [Rhodoferax sp.]
MGYLTVDNLGKAYKRYPRKWGRAMEWLGMATQHERKWVLRGVTFSVAPGEAVGIIGINGAGKSTLLKIITGTTRPTTGSVAVGGTISALLELGLGFHPDFTGRQNVYLASQLRGMNNAEIDAKLPEIEAFAEIGDYIDQPVRTYSSGMQMRLAFSVATAVRPDILIVDEALSVGDTYFQHKSFNRIRQFRDAGTTLLFVSHSAGAIKTLCNRAILLDGGVVLRDDTPDAVMDYYNAVIAKQTADAEIRQSEEMTGQKTTRSGSGDACVESVELLCDGNPVRAISSGSAVSVRVRGKVMAPVAELTVGILMRDRLGNDVFGTNTHHHGISKNDVAQGASFCVDFDFAALNLGPGSYSLTVALHSREVHVAGNYDWWDRVLVFQVFPGSSPLFTGVVDFPVAIGWNN